MALINLLEKWKQGIENGDAGYSVGDASQAFRDAWGTGAGQDGALSLYLPEVGTEAVGDAGSLPGHYPVKELDPPDGVQIVCESRNAVVQGKLATDDIFRTSGASAPKEYVRITGGTWKNCKRVFWHDDQRPLKHCRFDGMFLENADYGFVIESGMSSTFTNLHFEDVDYGIFVDVHSGTPNGYFNDNSIERCTFWHCANRGVHFQAADNSSINIRSNSVLGCLFQGSATGTPAGGINIADGVRGMWIERCFFDKVGNGNEPDIDIDQSAAKVSKIHSVVVRNCRFSPTHTAVTQGRIRVRRQASVAVIDCTAVLADEEVLAYLNGDAGYPVWLHRNHLHTSWDPDPASYDAALYHKATGDTPDVVGNDASVLF